MPIIQKSITPVIFSKISPKVYSAYYDEKRSKPVRSAKAALTRFGSVLRGTVAPLRTSLMAAPLQDSSRRAKALWSETCGRSAPRFAHKGNKVKRLCPTSRPQTLAGLSPTAPRGHNRPGAAVPARASVPRIRVH